LLPFFAFPVTVTEEMSFQTGVLSPRTYPACAHARACLESFLHQKQAVILPVSLPFSTTAERMYFCYSSVALWDVPSAPTSSEQLAEVMKALATCLQAK